MKYKRTYLLREAEIGWDGWDGIELDEMNDSTDVTKRVGNG